MYLIFISRILRYNKDDIFYMYIFLHILTLDPLYQCRTSNQLFSELAIKLFDLYNSIDAEVELIKAGNPRGLEAKECVKQARIKKISKFLE